MLGDTRLPNAPWLDAAAYPFQTRTFDAPAGRMRFVDEGSGPPIVFVHGNPTFSYVYRKLILGLRDRARCLAPDHLGFGQSDKPETFSYRPEDHAANLDALLTALDLRDVTLVVQDWGGPIGLSWAMAHPERVARLVILNTWCWPVNDDWYYRAFSGVMGGAFGRWYCRNHNGFVNGVLTRAYGVRSRLSDADLATYRAALPTPESRRGSWTFPKEIIGSSAWLGTLWSRRNVLADKPVMIAWGERDIAFRPKELRRWQEAFPAAEVHRFATVGHYVQDEAGEALVPLLRKFAGVDASEAGAVSRG